MVGATLPLWIPALAGMTIGGRFYGSHLFRTNDEAGRRDSPAGRVMLAGDKRQRYISISGLDCRCARMPAD